MAGKKNDNRTDEFLGLLIQNQSYIQSFIACLLPNKNDCDDVLQETLSEMWHKFDDYQEGTNFKAWGVAIARLKIISHQRKFHTTRLYFSSDTIALIEKEAENSFEKGYLQFQKDLLRQCLKKLSGKETTYLNLRYWEQLTFEGIADRFGITMQGAYKAVSLIHARLLKCIQVGMKNEGLL